MSSQIDADDLIGYLETHADELRKQCQFLREITHLAEQIEVSPENNAKLARHLRGKVSVLEAHEAWLHGLCARIADKQS